MLLIQAKASSTLDKGDDDDEDEVEDEGGDEDDDEVENEEEYVSFCPSSSSPFSVPSPLCCMTFHSSSHCFLTHSHMLISTVPVPIIPAKNLDDNGDDDDDDDDGDDDVNTDGDCSGVVLIDSRSAFRSSTSRFSPFPSRCCCCCWCCCCCCCISRWCLCRNHVMCMAVRAPRRNRGAPTLPLRSGVSLMAYRRC